MTRRIWLVLGAIMLAAVAFGALTNLGRSLASTFQYTSVPSTISYQGFLNDSVGTPVSGTVTLDFSIWDASTGGTQVWSESHGSVFVNNGFFSVLLGGQGSPLTPSIFSGSSRYLEVTYGGTTFPRQVFSSVPYALVANRASQSLSATEAITASYAYTAAYAMSSGSSGGGVDWAQVVVVAKSGGDYTSLSDAMAAISPTSDNRYLVLVMPGVYQGPVSVKPYVHVKGMGVDTTYIESAANSADYYDDEAATLLLPGNSQLSDLTVRNTGNTNQSTALSVNSGSDSTRITNVRALNTGNTGQRHVAIYLRGQSNTLEHVYASVPGTATVSNWALFSNGATFSARNSQFYAQGSNLVNAIRLNGGNRVDFTDSILDATTSGTGLSAQNVDVYVDRSTIVGGSVVGANGVSATNNAKVYIGASKVVGNFVAATGGAPQTEIKCIHSYKGDYTAIANTATACN